MVSSINKSQFVVLLILLWTFNFLIASYSLANAQVPVGSSSGSLKSNNACTKVGNPETSMPAVCSNQGNPQAFPAFSGSVEVVYYCQGNTQWANSCSLGVAGCGPTSMAMIMSSFGVTMTPPELDREWGFRSCGDVGSSLQQSLNSSWMKSKGFESGPGLIKGGYLDLELAKKFLDEKWLIIASSHAFPCANCKNPGTTVDHIFVVDGVDVNNAKVDIRDPNNCSYTDGNDENQGKRLKNNTDFVWAYAHPIRRVQ
jgi:hypothetical protein